MLELNPTQSSELADDVYSLTKRRSIKDAVDFLNDKYSGLLVFSESDLLKAKTGGPWFIKCQTAFGFILLGKNQLKGHAFFIFRGTQYLADWLTNLNISVSRTASGQSAHDGFNLSFKTMEPQLKEFMGTVIKEQITNIHCIGHSLGGALATLCADWIRTSYNRPVYLYTYGSPRVGLYDFASHCTNKIGSERIFRVYHKTDIVPCIPTWPFIHTPNAGQEYYLPSPGIMPWSEYHGMEHYINSVTEHSWKTLTSLRSELKTDDGIVHWLKQDSVTGLTITTLEWLNHALVYVLKRCLNGTAQLISGAFGSSYTLMDQLAYILHKGIDVSKNMSEMVSHLVRKIMQMLGMKKVLDAVDFTRDFIRNLFMQLQQRVNEYTQAALSKVLVDGRAI